MVLDRDQRVGEKSQNLEASLLCKIPSYSIYAVYMDIYMVIIGNNRQVYLCIRNVCSFLGCEQKGTRHQTFEPDFVLSI